MENLRAKLLGEGLDASLVDSMLASFKPKKDKEPKKNAFFAGRSKSTKEDKVITVSTHCQCCGNVQVQNITIKAAKDSPDTQKLACSVCFRCPSFIRQFTHEELVTMILIGEKSAHELHNASVKFRASLAQKLTPEDVITFTSLSDMAKEKKDAPKT